MKKNIITGLGVFLVFVVSVIAHIPAPLVLQNMPLPQGMILEGVCPLYPSSAAAE